MLQAYLQALAIVAQNNPSWVASELEKLAELCLDTAKELRSCARDYSERIPEGVTDRVRIQVVDQAGTIKQNVDTGI